MDLIQELDEDINKAQQLIDLGSALERLMHNPDFKKVVMQGFFEKEAIILVHMKADPNYQDKDNQEQIMKRLDAIGTLNQYFRNIGNQADLASKAIDAAENTRSEILRENLENV